MVRLAATGLATAFYRLFLLDALAGGPARPAALLARATAERLPLASGGFSRALHSLLEGGYLAPGDEGAVVLTPLGAAERAAEHERWRAVLPTAARLLGEDAAAVRHAPAVADAPPVRYRTAAVAEAYLDRVLLGALRERVAAAREGGRAFTLVLAVADIDAAAEATRRAIVHRVIRGALGGASTVFGGDVSAFRYGESGVAVIAPLVADAMRGARLAALVRARIDELLHGMTASVRAFSGTRWCVRVGEATWTGMFVTSGDVLRAATEALEHDGERAAA